MNAARIFVTPLIAMTFTGCATNSLPIISETQSDRIIEAFASTHTKASTTSPTVNHEAWLQPKNKVEQCKIYFHATTAPDENPFWEEGPTELFWDGDCKNGYAYGLGREFFESVTTGLMADIVYYGESGSVPTYHYKAAYDSHTYVFMHTKANPVGSGETTFSDAIVIQNPNSQGFRVLESKTVVSSDSSWIFAQYKWPYEHRLEMRKVATNNQSKVVSVAHSTNPSDNYKNAAGFYLEEGKPILRFVRYINGINTLETMEMGSTKRVLFTEELYRFFAQEVRSIEIPLNTVELNIAPAKRAVEMYKRRICQGNVSVDWMDDQIYGRICLPMGDLSAYSDRIAEYQETQKNLQKEARRQLAKMRAQQEAQRQAAAQQAQAEREAWGDAIGQLSASMQQFNQNATQFTQSVMSQNQPTGNVNFGSFGKPSSTSTNCVVISNIINCKTR